MTEPFYWGLRECVMPLRPCTHHWRWALFVGGLGFVCGRAGLWRMVRVELSMVWVVFAFEFSVQQLGDEGVLCLWSWGLGVCCSLV